MKKMIPLMMLSLLGMASSSYASDANSFHWPKHYKIAVALGYDDALDSQLDNAIPALNKYKLHGTFFVKLASPTIAARLPEWRAAAAKGHELGNHSLFHQCSGAGPGREWVKPDEDLDKMTPTQMQQQVLLSNVFLNAIDGKKERTFTAPCIDLKVGNVNYVDAIKSEFVAIRALGSNGIAADMKTLDPARVEVFFPNGTSGQEMIDLVKQAAEKGTMLNITFHGVGGDHLSVSKEAHEQLLKYLADNRDIYWTDTFLNVMKYVNAQPK